MSAEAQNCPECDNSLVHDVDCGEKICSGCGVVVEERTAYYGHESSSSEPEDRLRNSRAAGQVTLMQHDFGISTEIADTGRDYSGRPINSEIAGKIYNMRRWQTRVRVSKPRDRRLVNVLTRISEMCDNMGLPNNVAETASMVYREVERQMGIKNKSIVAVSAAVIQMACKRCGVIRSPEEICRSVCAPAEARKKARLASRFYREMAIELGPVAAPALSIDKYISKISSMTRTDVRVERLALEIAEKTKGGRVSDGKAPNGIAAAYLYVASTLLGQTVLQRDISGAAGVTEVTIRNRCKEILAEKRVRIVLRPSLGSP